LKTVTVSKIPLLPAIKMLNVLWRCLREQANCAKALQLFVGPDSVFVKEIFVAKILVVDDDPAVQLTIRLVLERAGHSVDVAGDGRKGLAKFEAGDFDLLCLDVFMPGMDGLETMRLIHQRRPRLPIVVISGRPVVPEPGTEPDYLAMATKLGAVCSLPKPFKPATLLATVAKCLQAAEQLATFPASDRGTASGH
jgi:CheY-like chemotaxis protein